MRGRQILSRSTRSVLDAINQEHICRQCLAQARSRALHTSTPRSAQSWRDYLNAKLGRSGNEEQIRLRQEKQAEMEARFRAGEEEEEQQGFMVLEGKQYQVARLQSARQDYRPANSSSQLDLTIGTEEWVKSLQDDGTKYSSLMPPDKITLKPEQWAMLLQYVLIESLIMYGNGVTHQDLAGNLFNFATWKTISKVRLIVKSKQEVELQFRDAQHEELFLQQILGPPPGQEKEYVAVEATGTKESVHEPSQVDAESTETSADNTAMVAESTDMTHEDENIIAREPQPEAGKTSEKKARSDLLKVMKQAKPQEDTTWMDVTIAAPPLKMLILQRIARLTGHRISDFAVSKATTMGDIHHSLSEEPKTTKTLASPKVKKLKKVSNVVVHTTKRMPYHKDIDSGRWKVIEAELTRRGLPIPQYEPKSANKHA